jgi:eukaryotic-like serine/threonine-protein kinase
MPELIGTILAERYKILSVIGQGGMGTVFLANHLDLDRPVAIKVLNPQQITKQAAVLRFHNEARTAGSIGHPNICEVYDLGTLPSGSPYIVMEYLTGDTLAAHIARHGKLEALEAMDIIAQVLAGLSAAHNKSIVHRDIKPENILLVSKPRPMVKILDFGVSKMLGDDPYGEGEDVLSLTRTGMVMGTPYYMSAEQARGERDLDGRVDVYACGVMLYEALAGKRPYIAPNYNALLIQIVGKSPPPLKEACPTIAPKLEALVTQAMARDRNKRFQTAAEFRTALTALHAELSPPKEERARRARVESTMVVRDEELFGENTDRIHDPTVPMRRPIRRK